MPADREQTQSSSREAEIWVHGVPAQSWAKVINYLEGDAHDRNKVQVLVDGKFYAVVLAK